MTSRYDALPPELLSPLKDYLIDYTWRVNGKEIVNCPNCRKHGVIRQLPDSTDYVVVHKESPRLMDDEESYLEFCTISEVQAKKVLERKETLRVSSLERHYKKKKTIRWQ